jgi:hypothetical protein
MNILYQGYRGVFSVDIADLDNDDDLDIISGASNLGRLDWWENDGEQPPEFTINNLSENMTCIHAVKAVDLNQDGLLDVIAGSTSSRLGSWINDGDGDFTEDLYPTAYGSTSLDAVDINLDGEINIVSCRDGNSVYWYDYQEDRERWWPTELDDAFPNADRLVTRDFDLDGDADIAISNYITSLVRWGENDGEANFETYDLDNNTNYPRDIIAVDLDLDLDLDLIVVYSCWQEESGEVKWFENTLNAEFSSVEGQVFDVITSDPIDSAIVHIWLRNDTTDAEGFFQIDSVLARECLVLVDADGFTPLIDTILVAAEGENTFDFELQYYSSIETSIDTAIVFSEPGETGSKRFTIGNLRGVDLVWEISHPEESWLSTEPGSGIVEAEDQVFVTLTCDASDLATDRIHYDTLYICTNDPLNEIFAIPVSFGVGSVPPFEFPLLSPANDSAITASEVGLSWEKAFDPNPGEQFTYSVWVNSSPDVIPHTQPKVEGLTGTSWTFLPERNGSYFWTVRVYDSEGYDVWASDIWVFELDYLNENKGYDAVKGVPTVFGISKTYPNPFNPTLNIEIGLPESAPLQVDVYNLNGQLVANLNDGYRSMGYHTFIFEAGENLASGIYFIQASVPGKSRQLRKVYLMK